MIPDNEIIETEPEVIEEIVEVEKPKKKTKTATKPKITEDVIVPVLFTKAVSCGGKSWKVHDTAEISQTELDKLPEQSYLVRNIRK
jgi:hypothetical protein